MAKERKHYGSVERYNRGVEFSAAAATGALSLTKRTSVVVVDGTDARTLAAPRFEGQEKTIKVGPASANTPILNVTVTGMRNSTQNVWTLTGWVAATAPRSVTFRAERTSAADATLGWEAVAIVSPGDAAGVVVA
jgi:hypothetical protein